MSFKLKLFFFSIVFIALLSQFSLAFALEIRYPAIPGAVSPEKIQALPQGERLPLYLNYYVRLFFILAIGLVATLIIYGGILYVFSGARPNLALAARERINQGLLGLFILVSSYVILGLINPEFLVFKIRKPLPPAKAVLLPETPEKKTTTHLQIPIGALVDEVLDKTTELVVYHMPEEIRKEYERGSMPIGEISLDVFPQKIINLIKNYEGHKVPEIAKPLLDILFYLESVNDKIGKIMQKFEECQCGKSHYYVKGAERMKSECIPGKECLSEKETCRDYYATSSPNDIAELKKIAKDDDLCLVQIDEKGNVVRQGDFPICLFTCENRCKDCGTSDDCQKAIVKIKEYRRDIQMGLSQIETLKTQLNIEQIELLSDFLANQSGEFLIQHLIKGYSFQEDFNYEEARIKNLGYEPNFEIPALFPKNIPDIELSPAAPDPLTFYTPVDGDIFPPDWIEDNQRVYEESKRFSLFAVLARLSLEELKNILGQCFTMAFGSAGFKIADEAINKIIDQAFKEGLSSFLSDELARHSDEFDAAFEAELRKGVEKKGREKFNAKCLEDEEMKKCCEKKGLIVNTAQECKNNYPVIYQQCEKECEENTKKMAKGLSRLLMDILLVPIREHLPAAIQDILSRELKDVIFNPETQLFLNKDLIDYLNEPLNALLTTKIKDLSLGLRRFLDKELVNFLPKQLSGLLHGIDSLLRDSVTSLKEKIPQKAAAFAKKLETQLDKTAEELIKKLPGETNVENLEEKDCCSMSKGQELGLELFPYYYFDDDVGGGSGGKGKCLKTTINAVNHKYRNDMFFRCGPNYKLRAIHKEDICEKLSGTWDASTTGTYENTGFCKGSGTEIPHKDSAEFLNFKRWSKNFGQSIFNALLNLPQQFFMALYQTTKHIAIQYAKVWVEDEIIIPFKPYLEKLQKFQKGFHETLTTTVGQAVGAQQVEKIMEKDIDQILKDICEGFIGKDLTNWQKKCKELEDREYNIEIKIGPIKKKIKVSENKDIRQRQCEYVCSAYGILHLDLYRALGDDINKALKTKVETILKKEFGINMDILNKTLAAILWPEITNIEKLIKGTPKQIICGELITDHENDFKVKTGNQTSLNTTCNSGKLRTTKETMGLLPYLNKGDNYLNKEDNFWKNLNDHNKKFYTYSCPFIWYICQNPLSGWTQTVGNLIAKILQAQCDILDKKVKNYCVDPKGAGCNDCKDDRFKKEDSIFCEACDRLNKTLVYSLFRYGMEQNYQQEPYKIKLTDQNPYLPGEQDYKKFENELENKEKERAAYQWLYLVFKSEPYLEACGCTRKMREQTKKVALSRGFTQTEWDGLVNEVKNWNDLNKLPDGTHAAAITLVSWLTEKNTLYDILTDIPLGVLKPTKPGQPTLLRKAGETSQKEFLSYTPYRFLKNEICRKVISDFNAKFPTSTIPAIMRGEYTKLGPRINLPYSVESLKQPNEGQAIQMLLANEDIEWEYKSQYLTCYALDQSPAHLLGLNQNLIYYLYPEEYRVLFVLIRDKLKPDERPESLNKLLKWLFEKNPVDLLKVIRKKETIGCRAYVETKSKSRGWSNKKPEECSLKCEVLDDQNNRHDVRTTVQAKIAQIGCMPTANIYPSVPLNAVPMVATGIPYDKHIHMTWNFWQYQASECPDGWGPYLTNRKPWTTTIIDTAATDKILGEGNVAKEGCADKEGIQSGSCGPKTGCYRLTTEKKIEFVEVLVRFLETTMGDYVEQNLPNKKIIELIFEKIFPCCDEERTCPLDNKKGNLYGPHCPLYKRLSVAEWQELQEFLLHTPLELLKKYLVQPLLDNEWVNAEPIMEQFKDTLLYQPYFDTIGRWTGLDRVVEDALIAKDELFKEVDEAASSVVNLIQDTFDKILREYPTKAVKYLARRLGFGLGKSLGGATAEQLLGKCWDAEEDKCKGERQFYNQTTKQCCDLGDSLVCQPRCRSNPTEQLCKITEGEASSTIAAKPYCCYSSPQTCSICREITLTEKDEKDEKKKCKRDSNREKFYTKTEGTETLSLCCWNRGCQGNCEAEASFGDQCCISIMDCMTNKFVHFLESFVETIREGPLLNSLKEEERKTKTPFHPFHQF